MFGGLPFFNQAVPHPNHVRLDLSKLNRKPRKIFTEEEDNILRRIMTTEAFVTWELVAKRLYGRTARQCRDRWLNYLAPNVRRTPWTPEEDKLLLEKINDLGTHWSSISKYFDGRSDNHIKNRWYSYLKNHVKVDEKGKYVLNEKTIDVKPIESQNPPTGSFQLAEEPFWESKILDSSFADLEGY